MHTHIHTYIEREGEKNYWESRSKDSSKRAGPLSTVGSDGQLGWMETKKKHSRAWAPLPSKNPQTRSSPSPSFLSPFPNPLNRPSKPKLLLGSSSSELVSTQVKVARTLHENSGESFSPSLDSLSLDLSHSPSIFFPSPAHPPDPLSCLILSFSSPSRSPSSKACALSRSLLPLQIWSNNQIKTRTW